MFGRKHLFTPISPDVRICSWTRRSGAGAGRGWATRSARGPSRSASAPFVALSPAAHDAARRRAVMEESLPDADADRLRAGAGSELPLQPRRVAAAVRTAVVVDAAEARASIVRAGQSEVAHPLDQPARL